MREGRCVATKRITPERSGKRSSSPVCAISWSSRWTARVVTEVWSHQSARPRHEEPHRGDELEGGSFSVSNVGMHGRWEFSAAAGRGAFSGRIQNPLSILS